MLVVTAGLYSRLNKKYAKVLLVSVLAGLIYGGWAAFVNSEHGQAIAIRSGLGQGFYAFFSTSVVTAVARTSYDFISPHQLAVAISFVVSFFVMSVIPLTVHWLIATPNVWQAISPGLLWGSGYIVILLVMWSKNKTQ